MKTYSTIYQTEAYLKANNVPNNCFIPIADNPPFPAFCENGVLSIFMVMLEESLLDYSRILELMKEYKVKKIVLNSCYTDNKDDRNMKRLVKRVNSNILTLLPESVDTYMSQLGSHTRRHVRSYERKFFQAFNSVEFFAQYDREINKEDYREILRLNRERCIAKGFETLIDNLEADKLFEVIKTYGVITIMKHENKIIAGTIGTIYGNDFTLEVISHDNSYNDFNLGNIIMKKTVEQAIKDKIRVFNFTWDGTGSGSGSGKTNWKMQFANQRKFLNDVTYYKYFTDYCMAKFALNYKSARKSFSELIIKHLRKIYHFAKKKLL